MDTKASLELALDLQEKVIEIQSDLQRLIRALADEGSSVIPEISGEVKDVSKQEKADKDLNLLDLDYGDFRFTKPSRVFLPDGSTNYVKTWKDAVVMIIGWMIEEGLVTKDEPSSTRRKYPIVSSNRMNLSQSHGNPESYIAKYENWWIDTWGNVNTKARNLIAICGSVGIDPSSFRVSLRQKSKQ